VHQVVRIGRVYQDALVGIATTPLIAPVFTGWHLPQVLDGRRQVVGRVGHGFLFRWWTKPILGSVCAGGYFLGFLPGMRSSPGRTSTVSARQSESSMWASIRSV